MNSKELRIGNYLSHQIGDTMQVIELDKYGCVLATDMKSLCEFPTTLADPIPLTEDWIIELGFEKIRGFYSIDNEEFTIFLDEKGYYIHVNSGNIYLKSVHQLQNLYYALTNTELTLKP